MLNCQKGMGMENFSIYNGGISVMGDKKNKGKKFFKNLRKNLATVILGVITSVFSLIIIWIIHGLPKDVRDLQTNFSDLATRTETLEGNYEIINSNVWSSLVSNEDAEEDEEKEPTEILVASTDFSAKMIDTEDETNDTNSPIMDISKIDDNEIIGKSLADNEEKTKDSMKGSQFILQYIEDGKEVYFYGKYNENGQWDGKCIINKYDDSKLFSIMDAVYENGVLKSYKQVFTGFNTRNQKIWYVSEREAQGNKNKGKTTTYFFYGDYQKNFDSNSVSADDILSVEKFAGTIPSTIEGYYNGYTSDGKFNDDSGDAYIAKYDNKGNIRYLYVGKIKDGFPNDQTGNAWSIAWGYANDGYHYYKGTFTNGEQDKKPKSWYKPMTQEEIEKIVNQEDFDCELTGLFPEDT